MSKAVFFEISWEVCNMVGGIHTVLATRVPEVQERHGEDGYITIGPDIPRTEGVAAEFRPDVWDRELADSLADHEVSVVMGRWLVPGDGQKGRIAQRALLRAMSIEGVVVVVFNGIK